MPPVVPHKRLRSDSPPSDPQPPKRAARKPPSKRNRHPRHNQESVFQTLDTPPTISRSLSQTRALLELEDEESELSEPDSSEDEFEDVVIDEPAKVEKAKGRIRAKNTEDNSEGEDDDWEDALGSGKNNEPMPVISGDIELTLSPFTTPTAFASKQDSKKGPSKIQRQIRNVTHCMHVQFLMFHNLIRNGWVQDQRVQKILVENLTTGCWREMDRYWRDAGISNGPERVVRGGWSRKTAAEIAPAGKWKDIGRNGVKVFESSTGKENMPGADPGNESSGGKGKDIRGNDRNQRDWGATSDRVEPNTPNLSAGDPLLRLLKYLSAYWKSKFKITTPALRKRGYLSPITLEAEITAWKENLLDPDAFGERVENLEAYRDAARKCEGSRDVGQQLFTALLRGLGIEARMVTSLQPVGFGWSQNEEGTPKNLENLRAKAETPIAPASLGATSIRPRRSDAPIIISDGESSALSSVISISSDSEAETKIATKPRKARKYGDELPYPTYWTEAISHLTHTPIVSSPLPRPIIVTSATPEQLASFYCRGAAADKAKQVFAYIVAFSSDGTAKDVTTRYLPKHQWPGKTKGVRIPVEKIPIYNKHGRVAKWEEWDWFKSVMRPFSRPHDKRQPWDEVEDEGDLIPTKPPKPKDMDEEGGKETLQGYKNSAEYILERHLKREEALKPGSNIVRYFRTGKGDNEKSEPVYRRKDIVTCKTVESWHKEGRAVKEGEQPLKYVPYRAVTVARKREIEEREREEGGKIKQALYSKDQTEWIIPVPIVNGKIPRNAFGNIDVYVPTMIPKGAVHIPLKGTARICKKLNIDFAEACTGFEFGKQRAVPVLTGVVVAADNEDLVIDAWEADEAERARKEQDKREKFLLGLWKRFSMGLRIVERIRLEYGDEAELPEKESTVGNQEVKRSEWDTFKDHQNFEGGFLREEPRPCGLAQESNHPHHGDDIAGGFFPPSQEDVIIHNGELTIEHGEDGEPNQPKRAAANTYRSPISLHSALQRPLHGEDYGYEDGAQSTAYPISEEEKPSVVPRSNRKSRGKTQSSRGRVGGRSGKRKSTSLQKMVDEDEDEESPLSELSTGSAAFESEISPYDSNGYEHASMTPACKPTELISSLSQETPKRKAAKKSNAMIKSHFFAHRSDDETDLRGTSPRKKGSVKSRGKRGRSRGRGKVNGNP